MKPLEVLSLVVVFLAMGEGRLKNLLSLMPEDTRTIAENLYSTIPGTLEKFLAPTNTNWKIKVNLTTITSISRVHLKNNDDLVNDLQEQIQKKFDHERMTLNLSRILSERIGNETQGEFESKTMKIVKFNGEYIEEESAYWSDVIYYVYGEIKYEISRNPLLIHFEWAMEIARKYVPEWILLLFESLLDTTYEWQFVLAIDINGLTIRTKKMIELSDLIKEKDFDGTRKFLQSKYKITWDDL